MAPRRALLEKARERVKGRQLGTSGSFTIAVNHNFNFANRRRDGGVDSGDAEVAAAEEAIWEKLRDSIGILRLPLQDWVMRAAREAGGLPKLAAAILGIPLPANHKERRANKPFAAELRKLQEYEQGKYKNASGARRERIAAYGGAGNPYTPEEDIEDAGDGVYVAVAVMGDWQISKDHRIFQLKHTDGEGFSTVRDAIDRSGVGLCGYVADNAIDEPMELLRVYSIELEWG